jgi:hypothetical protein
MSGSLDLITPARVQRGTPLVATVDVRGALPGAEITVRLEQKRGPEPRVAPQEKRASAGPAGTASASFSIALAASGAAVLLATASDRDGAFFQPDAEIVEVL